MKPRLKESQMVPWWVNDGDVDLWERIPVGRPCQSSVSSSSKSWVAWLDTSNLVRLETSEGCLFFDQTWTSGQFSGRTGLGFPEYISLRALCCGYVGPCRQLFANTRWEHLFTDESVDNWLEDYWVTRLGTIDAIVSSGWNGKVDAGLRLCVPERTSSLVASEWMDSGDLVFWSFQAGTDLVAAQDRAIRVLEKHLSLLSQQINRNVRGAQ